jgi:hypothetical protein
MSAWRRQSRPAADTRTQPTRPQEARADLLLLPPDSRVPAAAGVSPAHPHSTADQLASKRQQWVDTGIARGKGAGMGEHCVCAREAQKRCRLGWRCAHMLYHRQAQHSCPLCMHRGGCVCHLLCAVPPQAQPPPSCGPTRPTCSTHATKVQQGAVWGPQCGFQRSASRPLCKATHRTFACHAPFVPHAHPCSRTAGLGGLYGYAHSCVLQGASSLQRGRAGICCYPCNHTLHCMLTRVQPEQGEARGSQPVHLPPQPPCVQPSCSRPGHTTLTGKGKKTLAAAPHAAQHNRQPTGFRELLRPAAGLWGAQGSGGQGGTSPCSHANSEQHNNALPSLLLKAQAS